MTGNTEHERLSQSSNNRNWKKWGPYLSDRQWGTVREDYSPEGNAWNFVNHDLARSYAYRWGEEGIAGFVTASDLMVCRFCILERERFHYQRTAFRPHQWIR
jgi:hypothetical protein